MSVRVGGIYAELSLDDSRFTRSLDAAQRGMTSLQQAAQQAAQRVDRSFQNSGTAVEQTGRSARQAAERIEDVGDAAQTAARQVDRVGEAATDAARDVGRIEDAADEAATATRRIEIPSGLAAAAQRAADAVGSIGERASGAASTGSNMGDSFVGGFSGKLQGLAGKGGPIAAALVGVAGIGLAAGAILAKSIGEGMDMEADRDLVQARLGINDETMRMIGSAAGAAFSNGWGESVQDNIDAASMLISAGVLTGEETTGGMQAVLEKAQAVNDLVGGEMVDTVKAAGIMMKNGLAADSTEAFDLIFRGYQTVGLAGDDYMDSIKEYSSGWKNVGLSGQQALAILAQSTNRLGADSTDRAADAMRELGRRISEEGEAMVEGMDEIGLSGQDMYDRLAKGGDEGFQALDEIFDVLRKIEDPAKRNTAIIALLGDTAGDFYDVFSNLDPSEAMADFGDAAEATERAITTMTDNGKASFDAARNSITASLDDVKLMLGEAFGPHLAKLADWVSKHKPEILGFFVALANGALSTLDGLVAFVSGGLRAFADLQEGIGDTVGKGIAALGSFASAAGGIIKHIPGMEKVGGALEGAGRMASGFGTMMDGAADKARGMADALDAARPTIGKIRDQVADAGQAAVGAAEMTRIFGGAVDALPENKDLYITALTDDAIRRLEEANFKVTHLDDGTFKVSANTLEAQTMLDQFVKANDGRVIKTFTENEITDKRAEWTGSPTGPQKQGPVPMAPGEWRADGGIDLDRYANGTLPDQAEIKSATGRWIQWAEPETGGEAFIPLAPSKRGRSLAILSETARRFGAQVVSSDPLVSSMLAFGRGGVLSFANGGVVAEAKALAANAAGSPYQYGGVGNPSWDCSGIQSDMYAKLTGKPTGVRHFTTETDFTTLGFIAGDGGPNDYRIGVMRGGGGPDSHMAGTLPGGYNVESSGSDGVEYGPNAKGAADFPLRWYLPLSGNPTDGVTGDTAAGSPGSGGSAGSGGAGSASVTGQPVFVTNWPASLGGSSSSASSDTSTGADTGGGTSTEDPNTLGRYTFKLFANGGVEDHSAHIAPGGSWRVFGEPETGGEAYIPLAPGKRGRSAALLSQVADRFGFSLTPYAMGGFGGLGQDGDGGVHTGSWEVSQLGDRDAVPLSTPGRDVPLAVMASSAYRAAAFAAGAALAFGTGWKSDGTFQGFDTSSNSLPDGWGDKYTEVLELLTRVAEAAEKGNPVSVDVAVDPSQRQAEIQIKQQGV